jgi:xanthine dehydrogenase YagT iron-sulfur-binding subunit
MTARGIRRRTVVAATAAGGLLAGTGAGRALAREEAAPIPQPHPGPQLVTVTLAINGVRKAHRLDARTSLLDTLRELSGLTGTKKGCDHGQCGACTVLVNGRRINACLTLAVMHDGDEVVTVEGLGSEEALHPLQEAFVRNDAFQCGYCTPGQICSAVGMLSEHAAGWPSHATRDIAATSISLSDVEIRERMSGNICRCAAYPNILAAIREATGRRG